MAIGAYFQPESMSAAQYDQIMQKLDEAGQASPAGRMYHVCFGGDGHLQVFDIWDSPENFEKFGATLMPILEQIGVQVGEPMIEPVHNTVG